MSNIKIIAVDGLDGSGKSCFVHKLTSYLKGYCTNPDLNIVSYHLPDLSTTSGRKLKKIFEDKDRLVDEKLANTIAELNSKNKREWWEKHWDEWSKKDTLIVLDRYILSNYIYNAIHMSDVQGFCNRLMEIDSDKYKTKEPDLQIFLYCNEKLQMDRLQHRDALKLYEDDTTQKKIRNNAYKIFDYVSHAKYKLCLPAHLLDKSYLEANDLTRENLDAAVESNFFYRIGMVVNKMYGPKTFKKPNKIRVVHNMVDLDIEEFITKSGVNIFDKA